MKTRKFLAILLTLAMCLGMLPGMAWATDDPEASFNPTNGAGGSTSGTFTDALSYGYNFDDLGNQAISIQLAKDITLSDNLAFAGNNGKKVIYAISSGKTDDDGNEQEVTITQNGHTIMIPAGVNVTLGETVSVAEGENIDLFSAPEGYTVRKATYSQSYYIERSDAATPDWTHIWDENKTEVTSEFLASKPYQITVQLWLDGEEEDFFFPQTSKLEPGETIGEALNALWVAIYNMFGDPRELAKNGDITVQVTDVIYYPRATVVSHNVSDLDEEYAAALSNIQGDFVRAYEDNGKTSLYHYDDSLGLSTGAKDVFIFTAADADNDEITNTFGNSWYCDFTVSFDHDVKADSVILTGAYGDMIYSILLGKDFTADVTKQFLISSVGFYFDYNAILNVVQSFVCTAINIDEANIGTKANVSLVMWPVNGDKETDSVEITTISYEFTEDNLSTINVGGTRYRHYASGRAADGKVIENNDFVPQTARGPHFATTNVAKIGETKYETLAAAISHATSGDTIELLADIADAGSINLPAGVTLDGSSSSGNYTISGNSAVYINAAGGTVQNVNFENIHNNKNQLTPIYGNALSGTATVTGCSFNNTDWDMIQITPVAGATINITNNTFNTITGENVRRYIHIQSGVNVDFAATITGNKMYSPANLMYTGIEVYFPTDWTKISISDNYVANPIGVCLLSYDTQNQYENHYEKALNGFVDANNQSLPINAIIDCNGDVYMFNKVNDALNSTKAANKTVKLINSVTQNADVDGNTVTLDLNGKTLTGVIWVDDNSNLTIDGTAQNSELIGSVYVGYATNNNGSVTLNGGYYHCGDGATVLHINGTCLASNVTIQNARIVSPNDNGIQLNGSGTFVISNSEITGATGVYIKSGDLTVTNSTITGNMDPVNYSYNGNGANATGDGIVIDNCAYPGGAPTVKLGADNMVSGTKAQVGYYEANTTASNWSNASVLATTQYTLSTNTEKGWTNNTDGDTSAAYTYAIGEAPAVTYVAQIGEAKYETLAAAFAAVNNNETIELIADAAGGVINNGKTFTINLAGHNITSYLDIYSGFVTAMDTGETKGKIEATVYVNGSDVTTYAAGGYNKFILDSSATIDSQYGIVLYQVDQNKAYGSQIDINGTVLGNVWVMGNITSGNSVINVKGTVNATGKSDVGIALNGYATVNVNAGATITSSDGGKGTGIEVRAGQLNVTGGTITGVGDYSFTSNGNGTTSTGCGIAVAQHTTANDIAVTVSGGNINGTVAMALANPEQNDSGELSVSVTGGNFVGDTESDTIKVILNAGETRVNSFITGGKFSSEPDSDYIATGYKAVDNTDDDKTTYPYKVVEKYTEQSTTDTSSSKTTTTTVEGDTTITTSTGFAVDNTAENPTYAIKTEVTTTVGEDDPTTTTTYKAVAVATTTAAEVVDALKENTTDVAVVAAKTAIENYSAANNQNATFSAALSADDTKATTAKVLKTTAAANAIAKAAAALTSQQTETVTEAKVILQTTLKEVGTSTSKATVKYDIIPVAQLYKTVEQNLEPIGNPVALNNEDIKEGETFTFNIPVPANMTAEKIKVSHIGSNGYATEIGTYTPTGTSGQVRYVTVTVDHFSEFELEEDEQGAAVNGSCKVSAAIALNDSIDINFYVKELAANTNASNYKVVYTFGGVTTTVLGTDWTETAANSGRYQFKVASCAAKQMNDAVEFKVYYTGDNGENWSLIKSISDYSIRQYCVNKITANSDAKLVELCRATLDYGTEAQKYFGYYSTELANRGNYGLSAPVAAVPADFNIASATKASDITKLTATLNTVSQTEINFYITTTSTVNSYAVTAGGVAVDSQYVESKTLDDGRVLVSIKGIAAKNLNKEYTLTFHTGSGDSSVTYSALAYAYNKHTNSTTGALALAIYNYYLKASTYFG